MLPPRVSVHALGCFPCRTVRPRASHRCAELCQQRAEQLLRKAQTFDAQKAAVEELLRQAAAGQGVYHHTQQHGSCEDGFTFNAEQREVFEREAVENGWFGEGYTTFKSVHAQQVAPAHNQSDSSQERHVPNFGGRHTRAHAWMIPSCRPVWIW